MALSARTEAALEQLAAGHRNYLAANPDLAPGDVCFTANTGRSHLTHRLGVVAASSSELCEHLSAFIAGQPGGGNHRGTERRRAPSGFYIYRPGFPVRQGWDTNSTGPNPRFARPWTGAMKFFGPVWKLRCWRFCIRRRRRILRWMKPPAPNRRFSLWNMPWLSSGIPGAIKPSAVMGHSLGEYVAACVAGVFSLEDGLKLDRSASASHAGLAAGRSDGLGVCRAKDRVAAAILPHSDDVSVAALNGPQHVVISGRRRGGSRSHRRWLEGIKTQTLNVSHAFHSVLMQPMLEAFESKAREVTYSAPRISLISNVTGQRAAADLTNADYWCRHLRSR